MFAFGWYYNRWRRCVWRCCGRSAPSTSRCSHSHGRCATTIYFSCDHAFCGSWMTSVCLLQTQAQRRKDILGTQTTPTHERPPRAQQENFRPYSAPPMPENRLGQPTSCPHVERIPGLVLRMVYQHLTISTFLWSGASDGKAGSGRAMVERNAVTQELRRQAGESKALKGTVLGLKEELRDAHRQVNMLDIQIPAAKVHASFGGDNTGQATHASLTKSRPCVEWAWLRWRSLRACVAAPPLPRRLIHVAKAEPPEQAETKGRAGGPAVAAVAAGARPSIPRTRSCVCRGSWSTGGSGWLGRRLPAGVLGARAPEARGFERV